MRRRRATGAWAWLLFGLTAHATALTAGPEELVEALREGGHVLYLPHAEARERNRSVFLPPPDCSSGTRLSAAGWRDAVTAGAGLLKRGIWVEQASASPVCAALHTAYLLFGADKVYVDNALVADCSAPQAPGRRYLLELNARLSQAPPQHPFNRAVVGHTCGLLPIAEPGWPECAVRPQPGDAVVFRPDGSGYTLVGCIPFTELEEWSRLEWP